MKDSSTYEFSDGTYKSKCFSGNSSKVYVQNRNDSILVYKLNAAKTTTQAPLSYPSKNTSEIIGGDRFRETSLDLDFLTMPFKFRAVVKNMPQQFNTNLNGSVYFGIRSDIYNIKYNSTPLNYWQRQTNHFGVSFGLFSGIGGTAINPWVTDSNVNSEYDGVVWMKGVAFIVAIDKFTLGIALGTDNLLDSNKKHWIYESKPWTGLTFGLNLN
jgi:hypothetical protein